MISLVTALNIIRNFGIIDITDFESKHPEVLL